MSEICLSTYAFPPAHTQAAARGVAGAQYNLGVRYELGKGLAQDSLRALKFYHQVCVCVCAPCVHSSSKVCVCVCSLRVLKFYHQVRALEF